MGLELVLRDMPAHHPNGTPLPPLEYLSRGPVGALLGTGRAQLLAEHPKAGTLEGAMVIPAKDPAFDTYLVWFEGDVVSRVVARHRTKKEELPNGAKASEKLIRLWTGQFAQFGWPWMQEAQGTEFKNWGAADGRTRFRIFWQSTGNGIQLFSEWRNAPHGG